MIKTWGINHALNNLYHRPVGSEHHVAARINNRCLILSTLIDMQTDYRLVNMIYILKQFL